MKIVFATHNKNKLKEVQAAMPKEIQLVSLSDIGCHEPIEETENSLEANARLKADYVYKNYGVACFADDTGLEVEALDLAPGVYSARYAGEDVTDADNRKKLLKNMKSHLNKAAQFRTSIALRLNQDQIVYFDGICRGSILEIEKGDQGFGYDPVFQPEGYSISFAEMDLASKNQISHRGKAIKKLAAYFQENPL